MDATNSGSTRTPSGSLRKTEAWRPSLLPYGQDTFPKKLRQKIRSPLSNLLYRRILLWAAAALTVYLLFFAGSRTPVTTTTARGDQTKAGSHVLAQVRPAEAKHDAQIPHEQDSALRNVVAQKPPPKPDTNKPQAAKVDTQAKDTKLKDTKSKDKELHDQLLREKQLHDKQIQDNQVKSSKGQGAMAKAANGKHNPRPQEAQGPLGMAAPARGIGEKQSAKKVAEEAVERLLQQQAKYEKLKKERMGMGTKDKQGAGDDMLGLGEVDDMPEPKEGPADAPVPAEQVDGLPSEPKAETDKDGSEYRPQYSDDEELYDERVDDADLDRLANIRPELIAMAVQNFQEMPWLQFSHLNGYYHGLKTLVDKARHVPEYPNENVEGPFKGSIRMRKKVPKPVPYNPYPEDASRKECFLDAEKKVPAPSLYAYEGVPEHMPDPAIGSYDLLGIRDDVCFDRFGRYGPYGLGYRLSEGGTNLGLDTESSGSDEVWKKTGQINYAHVDWGTAQERCVEANKHRLAQIDSKTGELENSTKEKKDRIAVVIRLYTGFKWTHHAVLNFRALITELSLKSGGEYTLHFMLHVQDDSVPIWADKVTVQRILDANVPKEFHNAVWLWSEAQMRLWYPGEFKVPLDNPSSRDIHGVYRSAHLPLQVFAVEHPEYNHVWNWEMDMRFLGNYYEFFDRLGAWGKKQSRENMWERSARYYIPSYHGSWENFTRTAAQDALDADQPVIFGPAWFPGKLLLRHEQSNRPVMPASCMEGTDKSQCGVGEEADLITLNPIFDTEDSGWVFSLDATGYDDPPPRRCAIITASRLSRRLLLAMHESVWRYHRSMFSEMFPTTVALHHGYKAVYAPHPVYFDRFWDPQGTAIDVAFNGGQGHSTSGRGSPYDLMNEHNHKGTTWYFNSEFSGLLWRRWLGYAQMDGRGALGGQISRGRQRGGQQEEQSPSSTGRMCLRSMLMHPIKHEDPTEMER